MPSGQGSGAGSASGQGQGNQSAPGPPAGGLGPAGLITVQHVAAVTLSGHRAVYMASDGLRYGDSTQDHEVLGVTPGAIYSGAAGPVALSGELSDPGWTWALGPVYLGLDGNLTQSPPVTGVLVELGVALSATTLLVRVRTAIVLLGA